MASNNRSSDNKDKTLVRIKPVADNFYAVVANGHKNWYSQMIADRKRGIAKEKDVKSFMNSNCEFVILPSKPEITIMGGRDVYGWGVALIDTKILAKSKVYDEKLVDKFRVLMSLEDENKDTTLDIMLGLTELIYSVSVMSIVTGIAEESIRKAGLIK